MSFPALNQKFSSFNKGRNTFLDMDSSKKIQAVIVLVGVFVVASVFAENISGGLVVGPSVSLSSNSSLANLAITNTPPRPPALPSPLPVSICGDGTCSANENSQVCPVDCYDPIIAYTNQPVGVPGRIIGFRCKSGDCFQTNSPFIESGTYRGYQHTSFGVAPDNLPVFAAASLEPPYDKVYVVKCADPACSQRTHTLVASHNNYSISYATWKVNMVVPSDNRPIIVYPIIDGPVAGLDSIFYIRCGNADCTSNNSSIPLLPLGTTVQYRVEVELASDGLPIILYRTSSPLVQDKLIKCDNIDCTLRHTVTLSTPTFITEPQIAIDTDGYPVIIYRRNSVSAISMIRCSSIDCSGNTTIVNFTEKSQRPQIVIPSDNLPIISVLEPDPITGAGVKFKLIKCTTYDCSTRTVNTVNISNPNNHISGSSGVLSYGRIPVFFYAVQVGPFPNFNDEIYTAKCTTIDCIQIVTSPLLYLQVFNPAGQDARIETKVR